MYIDESIPIPASTPDYLAGGFQKAQGAVRLHREES